MQSKYFEINKDGHSIKCKIYGDSTNIKNLIIYGHGFAGHKDNKAAENFASKIIGKNKSAAVITFDLPGHGDDIKKKIRLAECLTYIDMVLKYISEKYSRADVFSYATSFGAYLVLCYIWKMGNPFKKIAFRSPAVSMYEIMMNTIVSSDDIYAIHKGKSVMTGFDRKVQIDLEFLNELKDNDIFSYDFIDYAENIIMFHGIKDEVVPVSKVMEFADKNIIELEIYDTADHRFQNPQAMGTVNKNVREWFGI